ncbi:hypothetical protein RFI_09363 [Reticulomyxa filosa]|uniref:Kelch motif family protein n=1 Tax=Reticulomyxa filosa TaxID=46433 RepID=X6NPX9_RETFI|nr:hypothetical protein RFI_09363 [Reticulomyxa filosa]|eukprot:ETO27769.1 hypothetical protein RFI_09363 [Reticulomyxa filosa]
MGNQTITKGLCASNLKQNDDDMKPTTPFETLASLPVPLTYQYKFICSYPNDVALIGHNVVKLSTTSDPDAITLLSFGGQSDHEKKQAFVMRYVSVWDELKSEKGIGITKTSDINKWMPFTDNDNNPVTIGRDEDNYQGMRAVIGGSNNSLLFISYPPKNIDVFDLNTFHYVNHSVIPTDDYIWYHCFVSKTKNGMVLFCKMTGLVIEYETIQTNLHFMCYLNAIILFFGGWNDCIGFNKVVSKAVYKYAICDNKWTKFEHTLPIALNDCAGIINEDDTYIHILGGEDAEFNVMMTHIRTRMETWEAATGNGTMEMHKQGQWNTLIQQMKEK